MPQWQVRRDLSRTHGVIDLVADDWPRDVDIDIHITAAEAFPAFERAVLAAETEVVMGFRLFDLSTRLRSAEARAVGADWFDLILYKLRGGVRFRLALSDFDPIVGTALHARTWRTLRMAAALHELAPKGALTVEAALHPAEIGLVPRLVLWPRTRGMVADLLKEKEDVAEKERFVSRHPGLARWVKKGDGGLRAVFWPPPKLAPVTHHQKVAVIDRKVTYLGGLDLDDRRWDTPSHRRASSETWHDIQLTVRSAALADNVSKHMESFRDVVEGMTPAPKLPPILRRTLSARIRGRPALLAPAERCREIEAALLDAIAGARQSIYIETQFLRDRHVARALARAARSNPSLRLMVVLPAAPEDVAFEGTTRSDARFGEFLQARCIRKLRRAFRGRLALASPVRPVVANGDGRDVLHGSPLIYVHAKVCIVDDETVILGSANLNGRSLRWDTELAVSLHDATFAARLRDRCLNHWLPEHGARRDLIGPLDSSRFDAWQRHLLENVRAEPAARTGLLVPYMTRPARRFGKDLPAVPDEMV